MFLEAFVCSGGVGGREIPLDKDPSLEGDPLLDRDPSGRRQPYGQRPLLEGDNPSLKEDPPVRTSIIGHYSSQFTSYWNAFLFQNKICFNTCKWSYRKVMFLYMSVILFTGGCLAQGLGWCSYGSRACVLGLGVYTSLVTHPLVTPPPPITHPGHTHTPHEHNPPGHTLWTHIPYLDTHTPGHRHPWTYTPWIPPGTHSLPQDSPPRPLHGQ